MFVSHLTREFERLQFARTQSTVFLFFTFPFLFTTQGLPGPPGPTGSVGPEGAKVCVQT